MKIATVDEIRKYDRLATEVYGIDDLLLMENAGNATYYVILKELGVKGRHFTIVAGHGNNGGDALVVGRKLYSSGAKVEAFIVGDPNKFRSSGRKNYEIAKKLGIIKTVIKDEISLKILRKSLEECDAVIDGVFGTGLSREIKGIYRDVINEINASRKTVISVDIPSGIGGNNGNVYGVAVKATYTVTFGMPKLGNILYPGYYYNGKLYVSRISYPPELSEPEEVKIEVNEPPPLPERVEWGHKGTFGKLLVVAGSKNYYGAPTFSSLSFLKAGGGYSRLAAPESLIPYIASKAREVVYIPLKETKEGSIAAENKELILELIERYDIDIAILGPGTSLNSETQELIRNLVTEIKRPVIIDGDGLTAISEKPEVVSRRALPTVLTPHPGELARLIGWSTRDVISKKVEALKETLKMYRAITLLKGAHTLIGYPDGRIYVNMTGNSGMATAGSGDVLTGTIAAMYGLHYNIENSVRAGVLIHGLAGDLAANELGKDGMTAGDILNYLPQAVRLWRERRDEILKRYLPEVI